MRMAGGAVRPTSRGRCRHPARSGSIGTNPNTGGTHGRTGIVGRRPCAPDPEVR
jgi:hypothetical protein